MPIHVDHQARRAQLARAVWRIVGRDGVAGASVRTVAREAGLSTGSVRHFFASHDQLLLFAVEELVEQARRRIEQGALARLALVDEGRPLDAVASLLEEVLPLDEERQTEARVWAAFTTPPATSPEIAAIRAQVDAGVRELCGNALDALHEFGLLDADRDRQIEIERLHALLDGLTIHLMLEPARLARALVRPVLVTQLGELATPSSPSASRSSPPPVSPRQSRPAARSTTTIARGRT
jgi:AcrR family transcriptional regulator